MSAKALDPKYIEVLERLEWSVCGDTGDGRVELEKYSPAGEDFIMCVAIEDFPQAVREYADDFDEDEHVEMHIEARRSGVRGVPNTRVLVEDAEKISEMLYELADALDAADNPGAAIPAYQPDADEVIFRDVLGFIGRFSMAHTGKPRQEVIEAFTCGCCFWFARILEERFAEHSPVIMTDYIENHFGTQIAGRVYDITGDVTEGHRWEPWSECEDENLARRITEYCINF